MTVTLQITEVLPTSDTFKYSLFFYSLMNFNTLAILGLLLAACLITGCSSATSDQQTAPISPPETKEDTGSGITGAAVGVPEEVEEKPLATNIWVQELKQKSASLNNYDYFYHSSYRSLNGLYIEENGYTAYVLDTKIKKVYPETRHLGRDISYNEVYLDTIKHTAYGVCSLAGVSCSEMRGKSMLLNYFEEAVKNNPVELMQKLDLNSKALDQQETLEGRQVTIITSKLPDGTLEKMWVDNYYGLPLKRVVYTFDKDNLEVVLEEQAFAPIAAGAGTVRSGEVNLPEGLVMVS